MELYTTVATVVISMIATLICKYIWDRYMSQDSRITLKEYTRDMKHIEERLKEGSDTFKRISSCLTTFCLVMLEVCEKAGIDCNDIRKQMIKSGLDL